MTLPEEVMNAFQCPGTFVAGKPYGSGHIHDTFLVAYEQEGRPSCFICQRINKDIFKDVPGLVENIGRVTRYVRQKLEEAGAEEIDRRVLTLIPTVTGKDYFVDAAGDFWRTYMFIENAVGMDVVGSADQAYESARSFGEFHCQLADFPEPLAASISDFHHTRTRFNRLGEAIEKDICGRAAGVQAEIDFAMAREEMVDVVTDRMASGEIPERVTHNDTKLNNVLIDTVTGKGMCVIDLDTVMPGSVLYDFGDMVRTTTSQAAEDESDLLNVEMNIGYFEALVKGYLETASGFLIEKEIELLPFSGRLITFETGLRFLTDYLKGDVYFKTHREGQNIDRCRKQFKMVESMERQQDAMECILEKYRKRNSIQ